MEGIAYFDPKASSNKGKISGTVHLEEQKSGGNTKISIRLSGFDANTVHGIHIHQYGDLTEGCKSACAHYNPFDEEHGDGTYQLERKGDGSNKRHVGDL